MSDDDTITLARDRDTSTIDSSGRGAMHAGGTVTYRVYRDRQWIGWIGDGREWRGWRYGPRRWWACWRQDGDQAARWSTGLDYPTRTAARDALAAAVRGATA